jgi:hypothetical protein
VLPLPHRDAVRGPFPNPDQPSDHIMIVATVTIPAAPWNTGVKAEAGASWNTGVKAEAW